MNAIIHTADCRTHAEMRLWDNYIIPDDARSAERRELVDVWLNADPETYCTCDDDI